MGEVGNGGADAICVHMGMIFFMYAKMKLSHVKPEGFFSQVLWHLDQLAADISLHKVLF